ncbi:MAG: BPL-N domain-containing protein, partial [Nitrospirota bacterium]
MKKSSKYKVQSSRPDRMAAFLWDESFLWGLMAYKALTAYNLPFDLVSSEDIRKGCLRNYKMLFVPGGWASNKLKALGDKGLLKIKDFVTKGGSYLGFCGGAGLATIDGLGLLNVKRKPTKERVPSFSGRIYLNINEHPIWNNLKKSEVKTSELETPNSKLISTLIFHAWWPSQFLIDDKNIKILATYGDALFDSFSSDLNVGDVEASGCWQDLEDLYRINLDPKRLLNEPAVIEGYFGKGRVMLSLIHFDTPGDISGEMVLRNLWEYLNNSSELQATSNQLKDKNVFDALQLYAVNPSLTNELETAVNDIIALGIRNFLWFWRSPMLLQWRRGVRGLEYCTLFIMIREIAGILKTEGTRLSKQAIEKGLKEIGEILIPFADAAKRLLVMERYAVQDRHITYEKCDD